MRDARIRFGSRSPFARDLRERVDGYFESTGRDRDGGRTMLVKTAIIFGWLGLAYATFLVGGAMWWVTLIAAVVAGTAMAGLGMAVQHDAGHHAYSFNPKINKAASAVLDFCGAASHVWRTKHGFLHHTYPNIEGADDDIELWPLARMAPGQKRYPWHRFQHIYMFVLYGFVGLKWYFIDDFVQLAKGKVGDHPLPKPKGLDAWIFWGGKVVYGLWALVIPVAVHGWLLGLTFMVVSQLVMGWILSITFQLAHCVEEAEFFNPEQTGPLELDFYKHQLATTVDFAPWSWLTWYVGGLNYQAVHHLFPKVSHIHYAALSEIVAETCEAHDVPYKRTPSLYKSLRSHVRWLRRMGQPVVPTAANGPAPRSARAA